MFSKKNTLPLCTMPKTFTASLNDRDGKQSRAIYSLLFIFLKGESGKSTTDCGKRAMHFERSTIGDNVFEDTDVKNCTDYSHDSCQDHLVITFSCSKTETKTVRHRIQKISFFSGKIDENEPDANLQTVQKNSSAIGTPGFSLVETGKGAQ